jgi:hypothetical protein
VGRPQQLLLQTLLQNVLQMMVKEQLRVPLSFAHTHHAACIFFYYQLSLVMFVLCQPAGLPARMYLTRNLPMPKGMAYKE